MGTILEKEEKIREGQAGFRPNRGCIDHIYTLGKIIQERKYAGLTTYCFFLDVQKAYDSMEKWVVENVENGEEDDRMCEKCYKARRENIEIFLYFARSCTRVYVITHFVQGVY